MDSRRRSLSQRLLVWLLLPIMALTAVLAVATYFAVLKFTNIAYDRALEDSALTLAAQIHSDSDQIIIDLPPAARKMLEFDEVDHVYFSVIDSQQHSLAGNALIPRASGRVQTALHSTRFYNTRMDQHRVRVAEYVEADQRNNAGPQSRIIFRVAETEVKRHQMAREVFAFMFIPELLFVMACAALVWIGIRRGLAPLIAVRDAISNRSHRDLSPLDESSGPTEVHEQIHAINALMTRLDAVLDRQRRFTADAAHQLRTPVAAIKAQTELALRQARQQAQSDELAPLLNPILHSANRLARLVNQLLSLSRSEPNAEQVLKLQPTVLIDVVEDVVASHVPSALAKSIDIRLSCAAELPPLMADSHLLSEMIANIIDNAIRYTPVGGRIQVTLGMQSSSQSRYLLLSIRDSGGGIPYPLHERVFERFYRVAGTTSDGSGLGLPIAREIAHLHGGDIHLSGPASSADSGLTVTIVLPAWIAPDELAGATPG